MSGRAWIPLLITVLAVCAGLESTSAQSDFDHFTTGFRLEGSHQLAECEACHTDGIFAGTPSSCRGCHTEAGHVEATVRPQFHMTTTDRCDACHRPVAWLPVTRVDHLEVHGACISCHSGSKAGGKPPDHIPANDQCDNCHRTTAWAPAVFDHAGIVAGCAACHNGMLARGKPVDHIPATNLCEDCHSTVMFSMVARVDHLQVIGTCSSCHNGVIASGQHPAHAPTAAECDACHTTVSWR